ncbi:MAG: hypothetical protein APR53_02515 [Methanoculleus sp. SDB]|nr:MAG: hypothetical protein APR53_02515 [Methanoculleus sp. SDB]
MESQFGRGYITNLVLVAKHFGLPPDEAWGGVADHLTEMRLPDRFRGTPVEDLTTAFRKRVLWHQPGTMDREDAEEVIRLLYRLVVAIDRELGIEDPRIGIYD